MWLFTSWHAKGALRSEVDLLPKAEAGFRVSLHALRLLTFATMKLPEFRFAPEDYMYDEDSRELLEGEGANVQERLVDVGFFNEFEVGVR